MNIMFKPLPTQLYFKVVNASLENKTTAEGEDTYCGTQAGSKSFTGSFADDGFSAADTIKLERGSWRGEVEGRVKEPRRDAPGADHAHVELLADHPARGRQREPAVVISGPRAASARRTCRC